MGSMFKADWNTVGIGVRDGKPKLEQVRFSEYKQQWQTRTLVLEENGKNEVSGVEFVSEEVGDELWKKARNLNRSLQTNL